MTGVWTKAMVEAMGVIKNIFERQKWQCWCPGGSLGHQTYTYPITNFDNEGESLRPEGNSSLKWSLWLLRTGSPSWICDLCSHSEPYAQKGSTAGLMLCCQCLEIHNGNFELVFVNEVWWDKGACSWAEENPFSVCGPMIPCCPVHAQCLQRPMSTEFLWTQDAWEFSKTSSKCATKTE